MLLTALSSIMYNIRNVMLTSGLLAFTRRRSNGLRTLHRRTQWL